MNTADIQSHVDAGLVAAVRHPTLPLTLYNYRDRCQYERAWDEITLQCRGLIMDDYGNVVARPFRKFFNDTEHEPHELPWHLGCEVTEKVDGSLGILFHFSGSWHWATRGSFTSKQAKEASDLWADGFAHVELDREITYLFEIIYPENRIVVDYGTRRDLVLLAMIETATGVEYSLNDAPRDLTVVRRAGVGESIAEIRSIITDDQEGYVVRFANGFRVKVKGARYMELHRIMSGVSSRSIWETLAQGKSFDELLAVIPDECADWVRFEKSQMLFAFDALLAQANEGYEAAKSLPTRKEQAALILRDHKPVASAVFAMLDGKVINEILWKQLYPEYRRPELVARMDG